MSNHKNLYQLVNKHRLEFSKINTVNKTSRCRFWIHFDNPNIQFNKKHDILLPVDPFNLGLHHTWFSFLVL